MTAEQFSEITTDRLTLRPIIESDWQSIHQYTSDPIVVKYLPWGPNRQSDTLAYLNKALAAKKELPQRRFDYAILLNGSRTLIGHCNLKTDSPDFNEGSIRYFLNPDYWGNGFATETAMALTHFAFQQIGIHRLFATIRPDHIASQRVLQKIGMRQEAHFRRHINIRGEWGDSFLYAMLQDEWASQRNKAVIFDMDGVIVDTEPLYYRFNQEVFRKLGMTLTREYYDQFVGVSPERMWTEIKSENGLEMPIDGLIKKEARTIEIGLREADLKPMTGLLEFIAKLEAMNVPMAIASSSSHKVIHLILSRLGIQDKFRAIVSGQDVLNGKPAPDIFLLAANKIGVAPGACVVIEDSSHGTRGAKAGGMRCVGFANPNSGNQDLSPADLVVDSFSQQNANNILRLFTNDSTALM